MPVSSFFKKLGWQARPNKHAKPIVAPPVLELGTRLRQGPFQFKVALTSGVPWEIQVSTDLKNWHALESGIASTTTLDYMDEQAGKHNFRFYRAMSGGVCSANAIGYAVLTLAPGFSMISNPFKTANNTLDAMMKGLPDGTTLDIFDSTSSKLNQNVFRNQQWSKAGATFAPGEGAILFNPGSEYEKVTLTGELALGALSTAIGVGFSIQSSLVPQPGQLHKDLGFPIEKGDVIHLFDPDRQKYILHTYGTEEWKANPPIVGVGEAFWVAKAAAGVWTRNIELRA